MTTRRHFLQSVAALPPALSAGFSWAAAPDPSRVALVIGNSGYRDAPLINPINDARAVTGLLEQAGFTVSSHLNAKRTEMMAAIERFSSTVRQSEIKQVFFYYAGHGAQLDWRNYLLPVDAVADTAEQLRQSCVDLNQVLGQLGKSKGKTFIIMLDACRNNPFGRGYQPEQKGLSQFDAPVGSLLAYATSPGNVASDGSGHNGLYTENLVRELSVRGTRIEDALKRVRLNVRLASKGAQIPWETTSLEDDVFIFNDQVKKLSEAEQEKLLESDLSTWGAIKASKNVDDWVAYLRNFPNGRFAEIAQTRLTRLLAEREIPAAPTVVTTAPTTVSSPPAPSKPEFQVIELSASHSTTQLLQASANPYSAGRYPLGRKYSVGDIARYRKSDILTGVEGEPAVLRVTNVDLDNDRIEANDGRFILDSMGNFLRTPGGGDSNIPQQLNPSELQVGKSWKAGWKQENPQWGPEIVALNLNIAAFEKVRVPAGEFDAFRIEVRGWQTRSRNSLQREQRLWLVPGLNFGIKSETLLRNARGLVVTDRLELVSLRQKTIDTKCAVPSGGLTRTLVIKSSCA